MCPLLTAASGKARPCAGGGCEFWAESFDPRYSACCLKSMARDLSQVTVTLKRMNNKN